MREAQIVREPNGVDCIARVPLGPKGDAVAEMDLSSYHALLSLGYSNKLGYTEACGRKYVSLRDPVTTKHILVARLIADCKEGQVCKYRDGNPLNLRLSNLKVIKLI